MSLVESSRIVYSIYRSILTAPLHIMTSLCDLIQYSRYIRIKSESLSELCWCQVKEIKFHTLCNCANKCSFRVTSLVSSHSSVTYINGNCEWNDVNLFIPLITLLAMTCGSKIVVRYVAWVGSVCHRKDFVVSPFLCDAAKNGVNLADSGSPWPN